MPHFVHASGTALRRLGLAWAARYFAARADVECEAGRYRESEVASRHGLTLLGRTPSPDPSLSLRLWMIRGVAGKYRRRFRASARAYARARALLSSGAVSDPNAWATLYHNLGGLEHARGRWARAEILARHSVRLRIAAVGPTHVDVGRDLAALGAILDGRGLHAEAETIHGRALAIFTRGGGFGAPREAAAALGNLAACLHARGCHAEAERAGLRALALYRRTLGTSHPEWRIATANLEVIRAARGAAVTR